MTSDVSASSTAFTPSRALLQSLAGTALKAPSVDIERLPGYLYRIYQLRGTGSSFCLLKCAPAPGVRLLAIEEDHIGVEMAVLQLLARRVDIAAPRMLEYAAASTAVGGSSYIISGPYAGSLQTTLLRTSSSLPQLRSEIDRSLGSYIRRLSSLTSPHFGPIRRPSSSSWARHFTRMLESILRDAEDSLVSLPYETIRDVLRRHSKSLDQCRSPRLTLLEACSPSNVVVDERSRQVSGLVDYSTAIWGDPFLSDCFYKPSDSFLQGYGETLGGDNDKRIRHLLYILYHSLLAVVRQCYRPQEGGTQELDARKALTTALRYLSAIAGL